MLTRSPPLAFLFVAILLIANSISEWPYTIRFTSSLLNHSCAALLALSIPISILFFGGTLSSRLKRILTFSFGCILLIPMLLFSALAFFTSESDDFKLQDALVIGPTSYRVYVQESGSPLTQPFTVLRKELDTGLGIKFVSTIWSDSHYGHAILSAVDDNTLEVEIDGNFFRERVNL